MKMSDKAILLKAIEDAKDWRRLQYKNGASVEVVILANQRVSDAVTAYYAAFLKN